MSEAQQPNSSQRRSKSRSWEYSIGRGLAFLLFGTFSGGMVFAIFASVYSAVTAAPKVWTPPSKPGAQGSYMKPETLKACVARLRSLDEELSTESKVLWYRMRHGNRHYLSMWQSWGRDWRQRLQGLLKACPLAERGKDEAHPRRLKSCIKRTQKLSAELNKKAKALWSHAHKGHQHNLNAWQDWGRDWKRRLNQLLRQCPIYGPSEIARAFQRASKNMRELQRRQDKTFKAFFEKNADLFRDIRQSMHTLQEELR